ncbi:MAG: hypothetical protein ACK5RG_11775 [Cyclobacteriaceae bacterium]|jgi:hypothetical protein
MNKKSNSILSVQPSIVVNALLIDLFIWTLISVIPALSHLLPFSLYYLEPMRIFLFLGYLLSKDKRNAYILALTIPLVSVVISGHPTPVKAGLISFELLANIFIFEIGKRYIAYVPMVLFVSILFSKVIYYFLKFLLMSGGLLEGKLITTPIYYQVLSALFVTGVFYLFFSKRK